MTHQFTAKENLDFASTLEAQKLNEFRNFKLNFKRNMFLLPWWDINLIRADTMLAELGSSNISSSKNCVAGFNINRTHTLVVQVLVSHKIKKGPVISTIIDDVLNGISLTTENWKDPPSPPGENILYLSSSVTAL